MVRSWTSSMKTWVTPSKSGRSLRRRVRMPVVQKRRHVSAHVAFSNLTL